MEEKISYKNYEHWEDYFIKNYKRSYDRISQLKHNKNIEIDFILEEFINFYKSTMKLVRLYLSNNGIFVNDNYAVISAMLGICSTHSDIFIQIDNMILQKSKNKDIIDFCLINNFFVFEEINNYFQTKVTKHER